MKAITLWPVYAHLIALLAKGIETRPWGTTYRGDLLIHAGQRHPKWFLDAWDSESDPSFAAFKRAAIDAGIPEDIRELPSGVIVAKCQLVACARIGAEVERVEYPASVCLGSQSVTAVVDIPPAGPERLFGDYTPGRRALVLTDTKPLPNPITGVKGRLSIWTPDAEIIAEVEKQVGI